MQSEHEMLSSRAKPLREAALIHEDEEVADPKLLHKMQPEVRARRAKYVRYVTVVGAGCMLLGLAGLVKHKIARGDQEVAARDMAAYAAAHASDTAPIETAAPSAVAPAAPASASAEPSAAAAPVGVASAVPGSPSLAEAPAPAASASSDKVEAKPDTSAPSPPPADTETPHAKTAAQEKRDCQVLLDRGAFGKAVDAGQRSVSLDPTETRAGPSVRA
jgi:hypothetical protein